MRWFYFDIKGRGYNLQSLYAHGEIKYFFWYRETTFDVAMYRTHFLLCRWVYTKPSYIPLDIEREVRIISQQNFTKWKFHGMGISVEKIATFLDGVEFLGVLFWVWVDGENAITTLALSLKWNLLGNMFQLGI